VDSTRDWPRARRLVPSPVVRGLEFLHEVRVAVRRREEGRTGTILKNRNKRKIVQVITDEIITMAPRRK